MWQGTSPEPKGTASNTDRSHPRYHHIPRDWKSRSVLGSPAEISWFTASCVQPLLFSCCISKLDFQSSEENSLKLVWKCQTDRQCKFLLIILNWGEKEGEQISLERNTFLSGSNPFKNPNQTQFLLPKAPMCRSRGAANILLLARSPQSWN